MDFLIASEAQKRLNRLINDVASNHEPAIIKGKNNTAVLVSADDWEDMVETIMVASDKDLSKSLLKGMNTPYSKCSKSLE